MKTCTALVVCIFLLGLGAMAQNPTDELLDASKAREFIQLRPDYSEGKFFYSIDSDKKNKQQKSLKKPRLVVSVPSRDREISIAVNCYNPFKSVVSVSDTTQVDPAYKSIEQFVQTVFNLTDQLPKNENISKNIIAIRDEVSSITETKFKGLRTESIFSNRITESKIIVGLQSERLIQWKYQATKEDKNTGCLNRKSVVLPQLYNLDNEFFQKRYFFNRIKYAIENVNDSQEESKALLDSLSMFKRMAEYLEKRNSIYSDSIKLFKAILETVTDVTYPDKDCKAFASYTIDVFQKFLDDCSKIQEQRERIVKAMRLLAGELEKVLNTADQEMGGAANVVQNSFIVGRFEITPKEMRDVTVTMRRREVRFKDDEIIVSPLNDRVIGEIRMRTHQTLIPEFSTGFYYTNVKYPIFGTQILGDSLTVTEGREKLPVVAAGMLNLTLNAFSGLTHPVFQLGVGTGKGRPSLLAGMGVRFRWEKPVVISGGAIWSWKKTLTNYSVGKFVPSTTALEEDLKFTLDGTPNLYIGVQINF